MRRLHPLRVPALMVVVLLVLTLPALLGCLPCGPFSLGTVMSPARCTPPVVTPTATGTPGTATPTHP